MIINESTEQLYNQINESNKLLKIQTNNSKIFTLTNYIGNLYKAIYDIDGKIDNFNKRKIYGNKKNQKRFIKKLDIYNNKLLDNFIINKEFHSSYIGEILTGVEKEISTIDEICEVDDEIDEIKFIEILHDFMKEINQEIILDKLLKTKSIYSPKSNGSSNLGYTSYNPETKKVDLFIRNFNYDLRHLHTLIHELGHCYDFNMLDKNCEKYNNYYYISIYNEVISRLFERLFLNYLIKNNIMKTAAKYQLYEFEIINHNFLLQSYLITLLDDIELKKRKDLIVSTNSLKKELKKYIEDEESIISIINDKIDLDIGQTLSYTYGDILSLLLFESIKNNKIDGKNMEEFMKYRTNIFNEKQIIEQGYIPKDYLNQYKKEIQLIKK